jgi:N-acetylglucosamine kinase-like BadF-type ATPase
LQAEGSGANPDDYGVEASVAILLDLSASLAPIGPDTLFAISSGSLDLGPLRREFAGRGPFDSLIIVNDVVSAWASSNQCGPGIGLIAGTGSHCLAVNGVGRFADVGGWGAELGDEGSAFRVARAALVQIVRGIDGRAQPVPVLRERIETAAGCSVIDLASAIANSGVSRKQIASLAPCVTSAAAEGDAVANGLLEVASAGLALHAVTAAKAVALEEPRIALVGGMFSGCDLYRDMVVRKLEDALGNPKVIVPDQFGPSQAMVHLASLLLPDGPIRVPTR